MLALAETAFADGESEFKLKDDAAVRLRFICLFFLLGFLPLPSGSMDDSFPLWFLSAQPCYETNSLQCGWLGEGVLVCSGGVRGVLHVCSFSSSTPSSISLFVC